jgi:plastocyanin
MQKILHSLSLLSIVVFVIGVGTSIHTFDALGQNSAADLYKNKSLVLSPNIRHFVVLIPNEAHESLNQPKNQYPLVNQAYLPQNIIVNPGIMVIWFNGDVDHDHKVSLTNDRNPDSVLFDSDTFAFNEASRPIVLNDTGTYNYYEVNVNENDEDFVMRGNITVISEGSSDGSSPTTVSYGGNSANSTGTALNNGDTAGVLMVPTQDIGNYVQDLKSKGFAVDSTYNFKDLRGGQKGTGDEQALLVWSTSGMDPTDVISALRDITPRLPYS